METGLHLFQKSTATMKYIQFKGDSETFLKFVEEDRNKQEKKVREDDSKVK